MSTDEMTVSGTFGYKGLIHWVPHLPLGLSYGCVHDRSNDQP